MLAQWVPLHAVSCSNLIETGGCAESREIPLRVTQACSECCSRDCSLSLSLFLFRTHLFPSALARAAYGSDGRRLLCRVSDAFNDRASSYSRASAHTHTRARVFSIEIGTWQTQNRESRSSERPRSSSTRISNRGKSLPTIVVSLTIAEDRLVDILRLDSAALQRIFSVGQSTFSAVTLEESSTSESSERDKKDRTLSLAGSGGRLR